MLNQDRN